MLEKIYEQQRWKVLRSIYEADLPEIEKTLVDGLQFSIRILTGAGMAPPGSSKMGGVPDLLTDMTWPTLDDEPLSFLAQFDMLELSRVDLTGMLPKRGMLYFFITWEAAWKDLSNPSTWRVLYSDQLPENPRWSLPPENLPIQARFRNSAVNFRPTVTLPYFEMPRTWDDRKRKRCAQLQNELNRVDREHLDIKHRMFGEADTFQGDHLASLQLKYPGRNWLLLLQIDSDERTGMGWGDTGTVYFFIRQLDLESLNFQNCKVFCDSH